MTSNNQLVSIGMPVYNDKPFLEKAIKSLLNQSYTNFELIISDDKSTDGSQDICLKYAREDERIKYIRQPENIGISLNMKFLLNEAIGNYFMWAANDDFWHKDFVLKLKQALDKDEKTVMAFSPYVDVDEDDKVIDGKEIISIDYSGETAFIRLVKLIKEFKDGCSYGLYRKKDILGVELPVWWWINKTRAYNNIYPTLCYYLAKGNYVLAGKEVLWYHRIKETVNHKVPFPNTFCRALIAHVLWKFNLVYKSIQSTYRAKHSLSLIMKTAPFFLWYWWMTPVWKGVKFRFIKLVKKELTFW